MKSHSKIKHVVIASVILGLLISGFAVAKTGDALRAGKKVTAGTDKQTVLKTNNDKSGFNGYGFRVQNKAKKNGGGALMSCYTPDAGCFYGTNKSATGGPGVKARSDKGVPLDISNADTTKAPMTVNSSVRVANLNSSNSGQLEGQGPDHYASAGVRVAGTGAVLNPGSYGLDTSQGGGDGVARGALGIYSVWLTSPSDQYLIQITPDSILGSRTCQVNLVLGTSGLTTITCYDGAGNPADSNFFFSATKP